MAPPPPIPTPRPTAARARGPAAWGLLAAGAVLIAGAALLVAPLLAPIHHGAHARGLSAAIIALLQVLEALEPGSNGSGWWFARVAVPVAALAVAALGARAAPRSRRARGIGLGALVLAGFATVPVLLLDRSLAAALLLAGGLTVALDALVGRRGEGATDEEPPSTADEPASTRSAAALWIVLCLTGPLALLAVAELAWVTPGVLPAGVAVRGAVGAVVAALPWLPFYFALALMIGACWPILSDPNSRWKLSWWSPPAIGGLAGPVLWITLTGGNDPVPVAWAWASCFAVGLVTAAGLTRLRHAEPVLRAGLPLLAALLLLLPVLAWTRLWACEAVEASPWVRRLAEAPDAFDLGVAGGGRVLVVTRRDTAEVVAIDLVEGTSTKLDLEAVARAVPTLAGEEIAALIPENVEALPTGEVLVWLYLVLAPGDGPTRPALATLRADGGALRLVEVGGSPDCFPANLDHHPGADALIVACEEEARMHVLPRAEGSAARTIDLTSAGSLERFEPAGDDLAYATSLWGGADLLTLRLADGEVVGRTTTGGFNWDLAVHPDSGLVYVPRFVEGQVVEVDPARSVVTRTLPGGFGMRAVEIDPDRSVLYAASGYDGRLWAHDLVGDRPPESLVIGTLVRSLLWDESGDRLFAGGDCGVLEIDHRGWLADR